MVEENNIRRTPHNIILEERSSLSVSGVTEVVSFDEQMVEMNTQKGGLTVRGKNLHISKTSVETGELALDGEIDELIYSERKAVGVPKGNWLSRIFHAGEEE